MAVTNPMHLSVGHKMRVHTKQNEKFTATLLHNDNKDRVLHFELQEGCFVSVLYEDLDRACVFLSNYKAAYERGVVFQTTV